MFVQTLIHQNFEKKHTLAIFLDISKASDNTWTLKIHNKLHSWNLKGRGLSCISSFLSDCSFQVCIGDTVSTLHTLQNGVPQGAVLSPLLFNIAIKDITSVISPMVHTTLFADDLALFISCSSTSTGELVLQETLTCLHSWSTQNGFTFSPSKSVGVQFCRLRSCNHSLHLKLGNNPLPTAARTLILLYKTLIQSKLDYGAVAYNSAKTTLG